MINEQTIHQGTVSYRARLPTIIWLLAGQPGLEQFGRVLPQAGYP
jgi:hypothetical protein